MTRTIFTRLHSLRWMMLSLAALLVGSSASAQNITCNQAGVQTSVDQNCQVILTADEILEGPNANGPYTIMLKIGNRVVESGPEPLLIDGLDANNNAYRYLNRTLRVEVFDANGNSCWSNITFEDKLAPELTGDTFQAFTCLEDLSCAGAPVATDNCGSATISLVDEVYNSNDLCANGIEIERTYIAVDDAGNISSTFTTVLSITQAPVTFPRDILWTCEQYACYNSVTDATPLSAGVNDTNDENGDGILNTDQDDDNDSTTPFSQDDDPITVGLICGLDDEPCPRGPRDIIATACGATQAFNLSVEAGGTGLSCAAPAIDGLEDDDVLEMTGSGVPSVYSTTSGFCRYHVTYQDDTLEVCNGASDNLFKILRSWRVLNWCDNSIVTNDQLIQVIDEVAPTVSVQPQVELSANTTSAGPHGSCASSGLLPVPTVSDNCSGVDLSTINVFTPAGRALPMMVNGAVVGYRIPSPFLAIGGPYTVTYSVADNCGNTSEVTTQVTVVDNTPPVAICDEITNLSLTGTTNSAIYANRLDDGSYDNCSDVWFKVLRMDEAEADSREGVGVPQSCGQANSDDPIESFNRTFFDDEAYFCCEDIATNNNMVIVRVFDVDPGPGAVRFTRLLPGGDLFGRYNDCMVEVEIEDKVAPVKLVDAPNRVISCTQDQLRQQYLDDANLDFDAPIFADNCDFTVSLTVIDGTGTCGDGVIRRRFQATDDAGNVSVLCEQRITSVLEHDYTIIWPRDEDRNMCTSGVLGDTLSRPGSLIEDGCDLLAVSYVDQRFSTQDDACYKILRTYDVINWCEWNGSSPAVQIGNPTNTTAGPRLDVVVDAAGTQDIRINFVPQNITSVGRWSYIQQIKVYDEEDPTLTNINQAPCEAGNVVSDLPNFGCGQTVSVDFDLTDNCGGLRTPTYRLVAFVDDANGDGVISATELAAGTSFPNDPFNGTLSTPAGSTPAAAASGTYNISGTYPLGTHVFVVTAIDLCGNAATYNVPFTAEDCKEPTPYGLSFITIDLMATGMVDVWASDIDNGSFDGCGPVKLSFSANVNDTGRTFTCADLGTTPVQLWVTDAAGNQDFIDVDVIIQDNLGACGGSSPRIAASLTTATGYGVEGAAVNVSGDATMSNITDINGATTIDVALNGDYTVSALLNSNPTNGVTTYDLYLIGQDILGISPLTTFSERVAADANANGSISAFDMTVIRRVILGLDQEFRGNTSWKFFNANNTASEVVNFNDVAGQVAADFVAVKIGDVNGDASANSRQALAPRTLVGEFALEAKDAVLSAGETQIVSFNANDVNVLGYQLTLEWDANALEVVRVIGGAHSEANFGKHLLSEGKLTMSHNGSMEGELFSLEVRALRDGVALSEVMNAGNSVTAAEAYVAEGNKSVTVRFGGATASTGNALEQNRPNPFSGTTTIGFTLAEAGQASLMITDVTGRVVWQTSGNFDAGSTTLEISSDELPASGLLNYTLTAGDFTATRKMVVIK